MEGPGDLPGKGFMLYVTNVDGSDALLRISGHLDKNNAILLQHMMTDADADLKAGKGVMAPGALPRPGSIVAVQYKDNCFYRARVMSAQDGYLHVTFIDYGNKDKISAISARTLEFAPALAALPPLVEEYVLARVFQQDGNWNALILKQLTNILCYKDHFVVVEAKTPTHTIISVQINGSDFSTQLVTHNLGSVINVQAQADYLSQLNPNTLLAAPVTASQDSGHLEHMLPFAPNRAFPANPASAMRMHNSPTNSLNGGYVNTPQIVNPFSPSQRLQVIRSAPRNITNLKALGRQPFSGVSSPRGADVTSSPQADVTSTAPPNVATADPPSPKKSLAYKVRFLPPNSEHKVYISIACEGPEVFAVQLTSEAKRLKEMMNELNRLPHRNLPTPPAPGTVCLGRQSSDRTICRALSMGISGSKAKLYFVDFGDTELVSFYDVFVIPEQFMQQPMYCFQFRLARSHQLRPGPELNEEFQNLVEHKTATLRVVQAEEAPLIQFAEVYINEKNVTDWLLEQSETILELNHLDALPVGTTCSVLVSYVDSCIKFFVQLSDNTDTLKEVMEAVEVHCKAAPPLASVTEGAPCCALFPDDGLWYRAQVLEARDGRALVCYVDYGNEQEVALAEMRTITPALLGLPAQALKCALKGFEDKPVQSQTSNQLEMLALEKTLRAHVSAHLDGAMLVSLVHEGPSPPLDIARHMVQMSRPPHHKTPPKAAPPAASPEEEVASPESSEPDRNRFRSDRYFREERRPRDSDEPAPRGGSFRARSDRGNKGSFDRSGPGRHSEKYPRGGRNERQGAKPWERNQNAAPSSDDWDEASGNAGGGRSGPHRHGPKPWERNQEVAASSDDWGEDSSKPSGYRSAPHRRKSKSDQPDSSCKPAWKPKGDHTKRFRQESDHSDTSSHQSDGSQRRPQSSVQQRLRRDNFNKPEDAWGEGQDSRPKRKERRDWDMNDDRCDKDSQSKDSWGERRDRGDKNSWGERKDNRDRDRGGEKSDSWNDKKDFTKKSYPERSDRPERSNFNPRDRAERTYDGNRSFGSNGGGDRRGFKRAPIVKELPSPVSLDTPFASPEIELGSQQEVAVAWFISPESFYAQITSQQTAFTDMMNSIPEIYKGVRPFSGNIDVGSSVLARFPEDRVLYRATVLGVQPFGKYIVQYIDFGNKVVVESKDIWQLDQQLMTIPKMAVHCSLVGVKPTEGEWKPSKDLDLCFNAPRFQCIFQECGDEIYSVSLWVNGQSVADMLAEKNLAVLAEQTSATLKDEPIDLSIVIGQQMLCLVTHVESFDKFHIQLDLEKAALVESTIANLDPALLQRLPAESVMAETHCTLTHEGHLRRAILQDVSDPAAVKALLPDYGYTVTVGVDSLTILPPELSVYYYQSLVCCFNNYDENSAKLLTEEQLAVLLKGNKFIIYINYVEGTKLVSTLYDLSGSKVAAFEPDEGAYPSVLPLCERAVYNYSFGGAYVSHAESLSLLYLQRASDADLIADLLDRLFKFYEEGTPEEMGSYDAEALCAAKSCDGNWYRATILTTNEDDCNVHFVDYGNDEIVLKPSIKKLDPKFFEPYSLALVVSLGLTPLQDDAVTKLMELIGEQEVLVTLTIGDDGWLANIHLGGEDLSLKLVECKIATPQVTALEEPKVEAATTEEPKSLPVGTVQVYIAHIDTPGQFWLQMADKIDRIEEIQAELQEKGSVYPELENKDIGTLCVAKYSVDEMWYRAEILDSDVDITTVRFLDYGNTDVLDNVPDVLKAIPDNLKEERHAVKASVNAVPTGTGQWSEPASDYFTELVGDTSVPLDSVIVLKDVTTYVDLFVNGQNLTDKLVFERHATRSEVAECGDLASCFASHVNSPSEFWIQLENSTPELQEVEAAMANSENFPELKDKEEGTLCAAKYPEDGFWYRAQIIVEGSEGIEVLFMDYGNASIANELRSLPEELKAKPALSRKCALQKPRDIKSWSRKSELKFNEMAAEGATIFNVQFIASGDISIVELYLNGKSVTEELATMCEVPPATERPAPLGQDILSTGTVCQANSPIDFYVTLEDSNNKLEKIIEKLTQSETFNDASDIKVGSLVVALWSEDEQWYRAKIMEFCDVGSHVLFIDYGNKAKCEKFKQIPEELAEIEPLAKHCTLVGYPADVSIDEKVNEQFQELVTNLDSVFQIEFLDTTNEPTVVRLLLKGEDVNNLIKNRNSELTLDKEENVESKIVIDQNMDRESKNISLVENKSLPKGEIHDETDTTELAHSEIKERGVADNTNKDSLMKSEIEESESGIIVKENISKLALNNNITAEHVISKVNEKELNYDEKSTVLDSNNAEESIDHDLKSLNSSTCIETVDKTLGALDLSNDGSVEGNLTTIIVRFQKSSLEELIATVALDSPISRGNESFQNDDETFSTPPDSPKMRSNGSPINKDNYEECFQTPAKEVESKSIEEKKSDFSNNTESKSDVSELKTSSESTSEVNANSGTSLKKLSEVDALLEPSMEKPPVIDIQLEGSVEKPSEIDTQLGSCAEKHEKEAPEIRSPASELKD